MKYIIIAHCTTNPVVVSNHGEAIIYKTHLKAKVAAEKIVNSQVVCVEYDAFEELADIKTTLHDAIMTVERVTDRVSDLIMNVTLIKMEGEE